MSNDKAAATLHGTTHYCLMGRSLAALATKACSAPARSCRPTDCRACLTVANMLQMRSMAAGPADDVLMPTGEHVKDKLDDAQIEYRERYMFDRSPGARPAFFPLAPAEILMGVGIVLAIVIIFSFIVLAY